MPSVLERVGKGLVSFGTGIPQVELDRANADARTATANAGLSELQLERAEASIETERQIAELQQRAARGDNNAMTELIGLRPEIGRKILDTAGIRSDQQLEDASRFAEKTLTITDPIERQAAIQQRIDMLDSQGRNSEHTRQLLGMSLEDQDAALNVTRAAALSANERAVRREADTEAEQRNRSLSQKDRELDIREREFAVNSILNADKRENEETKQNLQTEEGLRKEVNTLLKDFFQVADANARVKSAGTNPTAAGDLALIFNYMKMLDPGSTVREGEFANAENSASVPQRVRGLYNSITEGKRLSEDQRNDFLDRAESLFQSAQGEAEKTATAYEGIARNAGVNVDNVLAAFQQRSEAPQDPPKNNTQLITQARQAIANGADPEDVKQRVIELGGDPSGL